MKTGLFDKNGTPINVGDKTRLILENGEVREFDVCFKTVQRTTIKTLRGFEPESIDVSITGIFFCWQGNDLLPCVDENGVSDVSKMEVIPRSGERNGMNREFDLEDIVICRKSGVIGKVIKIYVPTACEEQTMVMTEDGRKYHAPTSYWTKMKEASTEERTLLNQHEEYAISFARKRGMSIHEAFEIK